MFLFGEISNLSVIGNYSFTIFIALNIIRQKSIKMNRLIIIGNGFDLAHGLKTNTQSFLGDYFLNVLNTLKVLNKYEDDLLEAKPKSPQQITINSSDRFNIENSISEFARYKDRMGTINVKLH